VRWIACDVSTDAVLFDRDDSLPEYRIEAAKQPIGATPPTSFLSDT